MANIYVTRRIPEVGLIMLKDKFGSFDMNPDDRVLTRDELKAAVKGRDAVVSLLTDPIDAEILDAAGPQCKIFSNYAVGYNNVDLKAAGERGVMVTNTPGVLTHATADLAITLMFACARRLVETDGYMRKGMYKGWGPLLWLGQDISDGRTVGIIGAGRIGANVATKMHKGFGSKILYTDMFKNETLEKETGAQKVDLETLLKESDFVSVHVNLTPETTHLINAQTLALMKPTSILVNTSRGPVVDEPALVEALKARKIFAAGLDVYEKEPLMAAGLGELDNVIVAPHIASATPWTRDQMAIICAQNLIDCMEGRDPQHLVNKEFLKR